MPPTIPLQPPPTVTIRPASERKDNEKLSTIALFAVVYLVDNHIIRKIPWSQSEEDLQPILREALIYDTLGNRPRIAKWPLRDISDYIEIKYYPYDLRLVFIHSRGVIHSDLALRQFFIDDNFGLLLGDFNSSHTEASDIFALGSTFYDLVSGEETPIANVMVQNLTIRMSSKLDANNRKW
ncbi:uncharacterized protein N7525_009407 [Penicillium rubens]|uniref:uncharacterized protein n=1 Tax=Penicillium rubens TaxID=1108849 RepID=UPI002A5A43FF|nr:uncharacterized protein N7525_009407 [Penicillium rubens]KAJ5831154.1 hypothetical protein N7525_009407 [Penicillium rubens]KAJ5854702.1 hypothetical protein N7534_007245 [Penicillium rubens]